MDNVSFEIVEGLEQPHDGVLWKIHEIIYVIGAFIAICTEAAAIFIIFRFGRLKTVPNVYFANFLIVDCCYNLALAIYLFWTLNNDISLTYTCVEAHLEVGLSILAIVFFSLVVVDWLLAVYFNRFLKPFRRFYKFILGFLWITGLIYCEITGMICISVSNRFTEHLITFIVTLFYLFAILVAAIQICRAITKSTPRDHPHVMLTIASIFLLFHMPIIVNYTIYKIGGTFSEAVHVITTYLTILCSILYLFLLYFLSSDFKACAQQLLGRGSEEVMAEELRDEDEEEDKPEERNGTGEPHRVSFHESNEELLIIE